MREAVVSAGAVMIDNSSAFRMDDDVPLVVPEVNPEDVAWHSGVIANPNCSTIQMVVALKPLADLAPIERVVVSTYQAASGAGAAAMAELYDQTRDFLEGRELVAEQFAHRIAFNCIPQIDVFLDDGSTKEEWKMVVETQKIMHAPELRVHATCVRVPVLRCHSEAVNVEFAEPVSLEARARCASPGARASRSWTIPPRRPTRCRRCSRAPTTRTSAASASTTSVPNGLSMWVVADQLRKGAALNAVQIAETLLPLSAPLERSWGMLRMEQPQASGGIDGRSNDPRRRRRRHDRAVHRTRAHARGLRGEACRRRRARASADRQSRIPTS